MIIEWVQMFDKLAITVWRPCYKSKGLINTNVVTILIDPESNDHARIINAMDVYHQMCWVVAKFIVINEFITRVEWASYSAKL